VLILWSAVFSLNVAVAEPFLCDSECPTNLAVDTKENVIRGGEDLADGWQRDRKQDEFDGLINCLQLIDGLLIKKGVSDIAKQAVHSGGSDMATGPGMPVANRCARWNEV
tara:strand:+ start:312 stop:641 length:330 start_codon:yes stop_codon:yes gene_type:complete